MNHSRFYDKEQSEGGCRGNETDRLTRDRTECNKSQNLGYL